MIQQVLTSKTYGYWVFSIFWFHLLYIYMPIHIWSRMLKWAVNSLVDYQMSNVFLNWLLVEAIDCNFIKQIVKIKLLISFNNPIAKNHDIPMK